MSYLGNTPENNIVFYVLGIDKFNGTGACTQFTMTRTLASDIDAQVVVDNVIQEPGSAYSVSGTLLTFTEAPFSGSNNVQVIYRTQNVVAYSQLTQDQIPNDTITTNKIASGAVTESKISANSVTSAGLANDAVKSNNIIDGAVTDSKIATGAVTEDKIGTGAVTNAKIGSGAVTSTKIGAGAVGTTQLASGLSVNITGGSISGITDLSIADGGTGASDATTARTNLGIGSLGTQSSSSVSITGGSISGITDLAVADGGTGASDAATARTNLGTVADPGDNGFMVRTTSGTTVSRTIVAGSGLTVTNANGVSGNPTVSLSSGSSLVKAWATINGAQAGTNPFEITEQTSYNLAQIIRTATGQFTCYFTIPPATPSYALLLTISPIGGSNIGYVHIIEQSTYFFRFETRTNAGTLTNPSKISVAVFSAT